MRVNFDRFVHRVQSSTRRPGTFSKSTRFRERSVALSDKAIAAIFRSIVPRVVPANASTPAHPIPKTSSDLNQEQAQFAIPSRCGLIQRTDGSHNFIASLSLSQQQTNPTSLSRVVKQLRELQLGELALSKRRSELKSNE